MLTTDPIADMLTRIRNALIAKHDEVIVPASNMKIALAKILLDEGYIKNYKIEEDGIRKNIVTQKNIKARSAHICTQGQCTQGA